MKLDFLGKVLIRLPAFARLVGPMLLLPACSEGPYLMSEEYLTREGQAEEYIGGGCMSVESGNGSSGGGAPVLGEGGDTGTPTPGFTIGYEGNGDAVHFYVTDDTGAVKSERDYDTDFLLSGQREEINVDFGRYQLRFVHWGGAKCEETHTPPSG